MSEPFRLRGGEGYGGCDDDMTLGEGKKKVLLLMDEYSSGGTLTPDKDIDAKMNDFFDLAQKNVAGYKKIVRQFTPMVPEEHVHIPVGMSGAGIGRRGRKGTGAAVPCPAPEDFGSVFRVWKGGGLTSKYPWIGKSILLPQWDVGTVTVEYFAIPAAIPTDAEDGYKFEVPDDAAACMPYFVAAQQLMVDLIVDPGPLMELYDRMVSALDMRLPSGGGSGIRQGFYR